MQPYLAGPADLSLAFDLIAEFGTDAEQAAAHRADRSRDNGNYLHFCRWRQVERMIAILASGRGQGTVH